MSDRQPGAEAASFEQVEDRRSHRPLKGAFLMIAGSTLITFNDAAANFVVTDHPVSQTLFLRALFTILPIMWLVHRAGGWRAAMWKSWSSQMVCAVPLVASMVLFIYALAVIPIAVATIIFYLSPLFVTALAPMLGERVGWRRWGAVVLGFCGAVFVIEPGGAAFSWTYLVPVVAALVLAWRDLAARKITASETSLSILVFSTIAIIVTTFPVAVMDWEPMALEDYALLAFAGTAFGISLLMLTEAFRYAEASLVSPIKYSGVITAAVLGFFIWGDVPTLSALFGAALIIASVLIIMRREQAAS